MNIRLPWLFAEGVFRLVCNSTHTHARTHARTHTHTHTQQFFSYTAAT